MTFGPETEKRPNPRRRAAVMYLIAAAGFLIAGIASLLGGVGVGIAFIVLSVAFVILALNAWASAKGSGDS